MMGTGLRCGVGPKDAEFVKRRAWIARPLTSASSNQQRDRWVLWRAGAGAADQLRRRARPRFRYCRRHRHRRPHLMTRIPAM